jgi:hypothetical protein
LYTCTNCLVYAGAIVSTFVCNAGAYTTIVRFFARAQERERERVAIVSKFGGGGLTTAFYG